MTPQVLENVRAEALFVSDVQSAERFDTTCVRKAVMRSVRRHGPRRAAPSWSPTSSVSTRRRPSRACRGS